MTTPVIESIHRGRPRVFHDERGEWTSSIGRGRVDGPVEVLREGLEGDEVAQPYHGGLGAAVCVHLCDHYKFWKQRYAMDLKPGALGENLVLDGITEDEVFVGDIVQAGTALFQVSGPRAPCANQARHVGRLDWVNLTVRENRTGFYCRVLRPGKVCAGDKWALEQRPNVIGSIPEINRCYYLDFEPEFARQVLKLTGLDEWWKQQFNEKLGGEQGHWTQTMSH